MSKGDEAFVLLDGVLGIVQDWMDSTGLGYNIDGGEITTAGTISGAGPCTHVMLSYFQSEAAPGSVGVLAYPGHDEGDGCVTVLCNKDGRLVREGRLVDIDLGAAGVVKFHGGRDLRVDDSVKARLPEKLGGGVMVVLRDRRDKAPGMSVAIEIREPTPARLELAMPLAVALIHAAYQLGTEDNDGRTE